MPVRIESRQQGRHDRTRPVRGRVGALEYDPVPGELFEVRRRRQRETVERHAVRSQGVEKHHDDQRSAFPCRRRLDARVGQENARCRTGRRVFGTEGHGLARRDRTGQLEGLPGTGCRGRELEPPLAFAAAGRVRRGDDRDARGRERTRLCRPAGSPSANLRRPSNGTRNDADSPGFNWTDGRHSSPTGRCLRSAPLSLDRAAPRRAAPLVEPASRARRAMRPPRT